MVVKVVKITGLVVVDNVVKVAGCGQCWKNDRFGGSKQSGQSGENDGLSGCGQFDKSDGCGESGML